MVPRLDCRIIKFLCRHCAAFSFCREVVKLAATRLIALHKNKGKSVAACLKSRTDYAQNPDKTQQGELVSSYECSPLTVDEEFMLSKRQYELATGRRQKSDVIAYQIRQSFKPGEITAEEANKVGYELAMRFTKGKYAFIVATHTDREHIHNHIIYNSTALDSTRKFRDFLLSGNRLNWYKIGLLLGSFWYSDFEKCAILYHKQNIFRDFQSYCKTLSDALPVCGSSPLRFPALLLGRKGRFD